MFATLQHLKVEKRDGKFADFDQQRIVSAIGKAFTGASTWCDEETREQLSHDVIAKIAARGGETISVETIQDMVERTLIDNHEVKVAKKFILYRAKRAQIREDNYSIMNEYREITFKDAESVDGKRENANVDGNTAMGTMLQYGSAGAKRFALKYVFSEKIATAHINGDIHAHDLDFASIGTTTCCQIDIDALLRNGFSTGHGHLREPQDIMSYAALAAIAIQSNQNDQHGGQSIPNFDYGLSDGVRKTFANTYRDEMAKHIIVEFSALNNDEVLEHIVCENVFKFSRGTDTYPCLDSETFERYRALECERLQSALHDRTGVSLVHAGELVRKHQKFAYLFAKKITIKKTYQSMESLLHNLNTMHSRAGAQVPFSSINFGTDTSDEGRLIVEQFLLATEAGLGNGETAIFPISIFKVKEGKNFHPCDKNYDLFRLACRVSAKRLFPNFSFLDAPFNAQYYKEGRPETEVVYMGCRTRVIGSIFPESDGKTFGRGNVSFSTINLPRIGIHHTNTKNLDAFFRELDETIDVSVQQLLERYKLQVKKKVKNFPFLMGQGIWFDSDALSSDDTVSDVLRHGTLSIGFIGLAETLTALTGKHHAEDADVQALGLKIVGYMRKKLDSLSHERQLNFTLLATPAEGLSGRFVKLDAKEYGVIPGVTDKNYYTNSFHIPVSYTIGVAEKIALEAPYHALTNAGHISYVELDGDPSKNLEAFEMIVRKMKESGIGYGSINHPIDRDPVCGYNGIIGDRCPQCGREENTRSPKFERIRRITGYLVGTVDRWNNAKQAELHDRVVHASGVD